MFVYFFSLTQGGNTNSIYYILLVLPPRVKEKQYTNILYIISIILTVNIILITVCLYFFSLSLRQSFTTWSGTQISLQKRFLKLRSALWECAVVGNGCRYVCYYVMVIYIYINKKCISRTYYTKYTTINICNIYAYICYIYIHIYIYMHIYDPCICIYKICCLHVIFNKKITLFNF